MRYSTVIPRERVAKLFIPCHRKFSGQMGRLGVIQLNCTDRWEGSVENWRIYNGFPAFWLAVFSLAWYKMQYQQSHPSKKPPTCGRIVLTCKLYLVLFKLLFVCNLLREICVAFVAWLWLRQKRIRIVLSSQGYRNKLTSRQQNSQVSLTGTLWWKCWNQSLNASSASCITTYW